MSERKRFRARFTEDPHVTVGQRTVFPGAAVIEEWSLDTPLQRPDRITREQARPGDVLRVDTPRPEIGRPWWDVMAEDPAPLASTVGAVMTVIGTRLLTDSATLARLLDHVSNRTLADDAQRAEVANLVAPWLRETFPDLHRALNRLPKYDDPAMYAVWLDGLAAARHNWTRVLVPVPPFTLTEVRRLPETSPTLLVRPDTLDQLRRHGRAN